MKIFDNFIDFIKNLTLKYNKFKYRKYLDNSNKSQDLKTIVGKDYTVKFSAAFEKRKKEIEKEIENIVKKADNNPYELIKYIKNNGTEVYKRKNANKILALINETEGFITPKKGVKALYLNFVLNKKISLKSKECFIMRDLAIDPYCMLHQFYIWYGFKSGFAGYEYETQENFNSIVYGKNRKEKIDNLSIAEILALKEALHRDVEAIDFVIKLTKEKEGAKAAFKKLKTSAASI